jgi:hypothetical protein
VFVVHILLGLASTVLWVWALVDAVRINDRVWADAAQNKVVWVIVIVFLHWFGAILYFLIARPPLKRVIA